MSRFSRFKFVNKENKIVSNITNLDSEILQCVQSNKQLPHIDYIHSLQVETIQSLFDYLRLQFTNFPQFNSIVRLLAVRPLVTFQLLSSSLLSQFNQQDFVFNVAKAINIRQDIELNDIIIAAKLSNYQFRDNFVGFIQGLLEGHHYSMDDDKIMNETQQLHPLLQLQVYSLLYSSFKNQDEIYVKSVGLISSNESLTQLYWFLKLQNQHHIIDFKIQQLLLSKITSLSNYKKNNYQSYLKEMILTLTTFYTQFQGGWQSFIHQLMIDQIKLSDENSLLLFKNIQVSINTIQFSVPYRIHTQSLEQHFNQFSVPHLKDVIKQHIQQLSPSNICKLKFLIYMEQNQPAFLSRYIKNYLLGDIQNFDFDALSLLFKFKIVDVSFIKINGIQFEQKFKKYNTIDSSLSFLISLQFYQQFTMFVNPKIQIIDVLQVLRQNQLCNEIIFNFCQSCLLLSEKKSPAFFYDSEIISLILKSSRIASKFYQNQMMQQYFLVKYNRQPDLQLQFQIPSSFNTAFVNLVDSYLTFQQTKENSQFCNILNSLLFCLQKDRLYQSDCYNLEQSMILQEDIVPHSEVQNQWLLDVIICIAQIEQSFNNYSQIFIYLIPIIKNYVSQYGITGSSFSLIIDILKLMGKKEFQNDNIKYIHDIISLHLIYLVANTQISVLIENLIFNCDYSFQNEIMENISILMDVCKQNIILKQKFKFCFSNQLLAIADFSYSSLNFQKIQQFSYQLSILVLFYLSIIKELIQAYFEQQPFLPQDGRIMITNKECFETFSCFNLICQSSPQYLKQKTKFQYVTNIQIQFPITISLLQKNSDQVYIFINSLTRCRVIDYENLRSYQQFLDIKYTNLTKQLTYQNYSFTLDQMKFDGTQKTKIKFDILPDFIESLLVLNSPSQPLVKNLAYLTIYHTYLTRPTILTPVLLFIVNSLNFGNQVTTLILRMLNNNQFAEMLYCQLNTVKTLGLNEILTKRIAEIIEIQKFNHQSSLYMQLVKVSGMLRPLPDNQRQSKYLEYLSQIKFKPTKLLSNPLIEVQNIIISQCRTLKSHAKVPLLIRSESTLSQQVSFIIKADDPVVQDHVVMILLAILKQLFTTVNMHIPITTYNIFPLSGDSGFIEVIQNASSLDEIGTRSDSFLSEYFNNHMTEDARVQFSLSTAAYSIASYIFQFKDRHNGNIMLQNNGRLVHIDFGFVFDIAPGGKFSFERAPFKLHDSFIEVMGGKDGGYFKIFRYFFRRGMLRQKCGFFAMQALVSISAGFLPGIKDSSSLDRFRERCLIGVWGDQFIKECDRLIDKSIGSLGTSLYDKFQGLQNDINY